jgi:hypothetical protein
MWALSFVMGVVALGVTYAAGYWSVETLQALPQLLRM